MSVQRIQTNDRLSGATIFSDLTKESIASK